MSTYYRPDTLEQALALMNEHTGVIKPYAGGTDLMVHLREQGGHLSGVDAFLDVTRLPELRMIQEAGDHIRIGAAVTHTEVADSPLIGQYATALCEASASVGSTQIRNAGTIGGNVCNGSLAADTLSVLTALSAVVELQSVDGVREVEVSNLYLGRGKMDIRPNELVVAITIPILRDYRFSFIKLGRRKALAISRMNVAVAMKVDGDVVEDVRIAPGCVFSKPERAFGAETLLRGKVLSEELFEEAGKAVSAQMIERTGVRWSTEYKQPVIEALTVRALRMTMGSAV